MRYIAILTGFLIATITTIGANGQAVTLAMRDLTAIGFVQNGAGATAAVRQG